MIVPYHFVAVLNHDDKSYLVTATSSFGMSTAVYALLKNYDAFINKKFMVDETVDMFSDIDEDDIVWVPLFEKDHVKPKEAKEYFDSVVKDFDGFMAEHKEITDSEVAYRTVLDFQTRQSDEEKLDSFQSRMAEIAKAAEELNKKVKELEKDIERYVNTSKLVE